MNASERPDAELPSRAAATVAIDEHTQPVVHSDPEIMGGTPVFFGTRRHREGSASFDPRLYPSPH